MVLASSSGWSVYAAVMRGAVDDNDPDHLRYVRVGYTADLARAIGSLMVVVPCPIRLVHRIPASDRGDAHRIAKSLQAAVPNDNWGLNNWLVLDHHAFSHLRDWWAPVLERATGSPWPWETADLTGARRFMASLVGGG